MRSHAKALFAVAALFAIFAFAGQASAAQKRVHLNAFGPFANPGSVAVDQTGGDVYVVDAGGFEPFVAPTIQRFDASGSPAPFSALNGQSAINGSDEGPDADQVTTGPQGFSLDSSSQIAIDSSGGTTDGNIYLADSGNERVVIFAASGAYLGQIDGSSTPQGPEPWSSSFAHPCGVAVDPSGGLYVSTAFGGQINRFAPTAAIPTYDAQIDGVFGCSIAADSTGAVYSAPTAFGGSGPLTKYLASDFGAVSPSGTEVAPNATAVAVDASDDSVFVDEGSQVSHLDSAGASVEGPFGPPQISSSRGVGVNSGTDTVYASEQSDKQVHVFGPVVTVPNVTTGSPSGVEQSTATLNGSVDPDGVALSNCQFEYISEAAFQANILDDPLYGHPAIDGYTGATSAQCNPAFGSIPTGPGDVAVSAGVSGLDPGSIYHFRLRASNANDESTGADATFATGSGAEVLPLWAGEVDADSVVLAADVNPRNQPGTTYQFQWGADQGYGNLTPVTPLGAADNSAHTVTAALSGLTPDSTYHFRLVATNATGTSEGADRVVTTDPLPVPEASCSNGQIRQDQSAAQLPDCRAYEKVSPTEKGTSNPVGRGSAGIATSGDGMIYVTRTPSPDASSGSPTVSLALREEGGWLSHVIDAPTPAGGAFKQSKLQAVSADLSKSIFRAASALTPDATENRPQLYLRNNLTESYQLLNPHPAPAAIFSPFPDLSGASADFSHILYAFDTSQTEDPVAPETETMNAYEWVNGQVRLVGVLPDGTAAPNGSRPGAGFFVVRHSMSADGRRIIFHATEPDARNSPDDSAGQLYIREDLDLAGPNPPTTIHVTASQRTDCATQEPCAGIPDPDPAGPLPAFYLDAEAEHGDKVLFSSCEKLTDDSTAVLGPNCGSGMAPRPQPGSDLYLYDVAADELKDLTTADPGGSGLLGVVGASDDLTKVYFVATGLLADGAVPGQPNLYIWDQGETRFIATLSPAPERQSTESESSNWAPSLDLRVSFSRVTPDGDQMLVRSRLQLSAYDNSNPVACPAYGPPSGPAVFNLEERCFEVYRYDASAGGGDGELTCVSCNPSGASPDGNASLVGLGTGGAISLVEALTPNISADGERVFFQSSDPLVLRDTNGKTDVYQWQNGVIRLISTGKGGAESLFADASASGDDVFFTTGEQLTSADRDAAADIYDARVDGGFPEPLPGPPPCEGDSCQSAPVAPNDPTPASSSFNGAGNKQIHAKKVRKRCKAGQRKVKVRGKARCQKKQTNETRRAGR